MNLVQAFEEAKIRFPFREDYQHAFVLGATNPDDVPYDHEIKSYEVAFFFDGQKFATEGV